MLSALKIINPLDLQNWDEMILHHADYSFFHSTEWANGIHSTYKYQPLYFVYKEPRRS